MAPPRSDDYLASTSTSGSTTISEKNIGTIETENDKDWFRVSFKAGSSYAIEMRGAETGDGSLEDPYIEGLYDSAGNLISGTTDDDSGSGLNSLIKFNASKDEDYFISAGSFWANETGSYTIEVNELATDDYTEKDPGTVVIGVNKEGDIESGNDKDWFRVALEAGINYAIEMRGAETSDGTLDDPYIGGIYDSDGILIEGTSDDDGGIGLNAKFEGTAPKTGDYFINAGSFWEDQTGTYTIEVKRLASDDYTEIKPGTVLIDNEITGVLESKNDKDWFKISLEAGSTYEIEMRGAETNEGTLDDPYIHGLYDSAENLIEGTNDDDGGSGLNSLLKFSASETGLYYISAGSFWEDEIGSYTIAVNKTGSDDFSANTTKTGTVLLGGNEKGDIEGDIELGNDKDWFKISLDAGSTYAIEMRGAETSEGTLVDPYIEGLYDSAGNLISGTTDDDSGSGLNALLEFSASKTDLYYINAGSFWEDDTGTYKVAVSKTGSDDYASNSSTVGKVEIDENDAYVSGNIESGDDKDWIRVDLAKDITYKIEMRGVDTSDGTLADP